MGGAPLRRAERRADFARLLRHRLFGGRQGSGQTREVVADARQQVGVLRKHRGISRRHSKDRSVRSGGARHARGKKSHHPQERGRGEVRFHLQVRAADAFQGARTRIDCKQNHRAEPRDFRIRGNRHEDVQGHDFDYVRLSVRAELPRRRHRRSCVGGKGVARKPD